VRQVLTGQAADKKIALPVYETVHIIKGHPGGWESTAAAFPVMHRVDCVIKFLWKDSDILSGSVGATMGGYRPAVVVAPWIILISSLSRSLFSLCQISAVSGLIRFYAGNV